VPGPPAAPSPAVPRGGGLDQGREIDLPGGPDAALLLHGLTGSTFELHPLAARLHAAGVRVLAPVMAGHGGEPEALRGVPFGEWVARAAQHLSRLRGSRRTLVVGGSMGGLVACALAHRHPTDVAGLLLLAPAFELRLPGKVAAVLGSLGPLRRLVLKKGGFDVRDVEMGRRNGRSALAAVPLSAVAELRALSRAVKQILPEVSVPALVLVGARDHTVTVRGARRLVAALGGRAELLVLPESQHLLGIDVERERCADLALRFLEELPLPPNPKGR